MRLTRVAGGPNVRDGDEWEVQAARWSHRWRKPPTSGTYDVSIGLRVIESIRVTKLPSISVGSSRIARRLAGPCRSSGV